MEREKDLNFEDLFVPLTVKKIIVFLFLIGFTLFFNGLFNTFVADDPPEITQNPIIQSLQNMPLFFDGGLFFVGPGQKLGGSFYRPIQTVFFSIIYTAFGPNAFIFHFFQVTLYIANACLVFLIFKTFFKKELAFVLSLVFLVHPINSESAFYISATQEVLFLFFGLLGFWIVTKYQSQKALILCSILLLGSLLSKETGILFFVVTPLYAFLYNKKRSYLFLISLVVSLILYAILRIHAFGIVPHVTNNAPIQELTFNERLINIPAMFFFYIKTFFYPVDVASVYQWVIRQIDWQHFYLPLIGDMLLIGISAYIGRSLKDKHTKKLRLYIFFFIWFLLGMGLHMQIIPLDQTVTTQWFYFPMVGILGMAGVFFDAKQLSLKKTWALLGVIVIMFFLSVLTFLRSFDWRDDFSLAKHDTAISKEAFPLKAELSRIYWDRGEYQRARDYAKQSIDVYPTVFNYTNLANAYFSLKQYDSAKKAYLQALALGDSYSTYDNYAALYINYGNPKEGISMIKKVLQDKYPTDAKLWLYLAVLEYRIGDKSGAQNAIKQAYKFNNGIPELIPIYTLIMNNQPLNYKIDK